eukprot:CAMPEP_0115444988 /NCGR_PEP_ID=MMETSP0271-20121206/38682_1 /TAXON_ID=71861 /ORGANISM="Scrippsiella trochoidea, Strain CCMP3099" /LENGTH=108 /DNA_ID=CAMNT_0002870941 /DNA_START=633 /DNA_END=955 /DNA_ORIENTATION=+
MCPSEDHWDALVLPTISSSGARGSSIWRGATYSKRRQALGATHARAAVRATASLAPAALHAPIPWAKVSTWRADGEPQHSVQNHPKAHVCERTATTLPNQARQRRGLE